MARFDNLKAAVILNVAAKLTDADAGTFVNAALSQVWAAFDWSVKKTDIEVITAEDYTTGTVAVTNGLTSVVGTLTVWPGTVWNNIRYFRIGSGGDFYLISQVTGPTGLDLVKAYQGPTATAQSYIAFQHVYNLGSTVDQVLLPSREFGMIETTRERIDRLDPQRLSTTTQPTRWCKRELSASNTYQIEFYPRPSTDGIIRVPVLKTPPTLSAAADDSLIRGDVVEYLATHKAALHLLAKYGDQKYDLLAQRFWALYNGGKGDTEGGALAQAVHQDQAKYGVVGHLEDRSHHGQGYSDEFLSQHDLVEF